jgi:hypothetical protein
LLACASGFLGADLIPPRERSGNRAKFASFLRFFSAVTFAFVSILGVTRLDDSNDGGTQKSTAAEPRSQTLLHPQNPCYYSKTSSF